MMVLRASLYGLAAVASIVPAALAAVHGSLSHAPPKDWKAIGKRGTVPSTQRVFTVGLAMQNLDRLESMLLDVSSPRSANYGRFMDGNAVRATFAPSGEAVTKVTVWLEENGVTNYTVDGAFVDFAADIHTANKLLGASYSFYAYNGGETKLRTLAYTIPGDLEPFIAIIDPSICFGKTRVVKRPDPPIKRATDEPEPASCDGAITPPCLKQMYSIGDYTPDPATGSKIGFSNFLGQSPQHSDVAVFEELFDIPPQSFETVLISGAADDQNSSTAQDGEANLDLQNIVAVSHPLPITAYIVGGVASFIPNVDHPTAEENENEAYLPFYRYLLNQPDAALPGVISSSYIDIEDTVPEDYARLVCNLIGLLGLRGITIFVASGDIGVGAGCLAPDDKTVEFNPMFPATCPYVTSVGGTANATPETAWLGSSGGFSKYFSRPLFQESAVAEYMATVSPETHESYGRYTNWAGRGFPDVSAAAVNFQNVYDGALFGGTGTSASAPVWAAVAGLLNDARFRAGKSALGWLNPLLYTFAPLADVLNDVTEGHSIGCNGYNSQTGGELPPYSGRVPDARWNAAPGWDPVTGLGTPNFTKLKELVLTL